MNQKQESLEAANGDRISELPDCVLSNILCKLTMQDLIITRVLSKRWLQLWELRRNLTFDLPNMFHKLDKSIEDIRKRNFLEYFEKIAEEYVKRVDEFMQTFPGEKIDSLLLVHFGDTSCTYASFVDKWVSHAIAKGVEQIDMLSYVSELRRFSVPSIRYRFPVWFFPVSSALKHLYIHYCDLMPPPDFTGFHNLESLGLEETNVAQDFITCLLSNPAIPLRVLRLRTCMLVFDLEIVSHSLHHFEMIDCWHGTLRISTSKLTVFEYRHSQKSINFPFLNAPQLTSIHFHKLAENRIPALVSQFSAAQVENLNLRIVSERVMPISITPFWNLKQLELTVESIDIVEGSDMLLVFAFLKASPLLQKLKLRRLSSAPGGSQKASERKLPQEFSHNELKEVEIAGCVGNWCEIEFAIYMMQKVQCLTKIVFNPTRSHYHGGGTWSLATTDSYGRIHPSESCKHWLESGREIVREKLQDQVPASVELVLAEVPANEKQLSRFVC